MRDAYLKTCARLHCRLANRKGMEMLQVVLIIAIAIVLGGLIIAGLSSWLPGYVEGLTERLTNVGLHNTIE